MKAKLALLAGLVGLLACVAGASAAQIAPFTEDFEGYADQAAFEAAWTKVGAYSMNLTQGFGNDPSGTDTNPQCVNGVATANYTFRNYKSMPTDIQAQKPTDAFPVEFSYWIWEEVPTQDAPRNFCEVRAYTGDGYGAGTLQGIVAIGIYNSPSATDDKYKARTYWGGFTNTTQSWVSLNTTRKAGWTKLTARIGGTKVEYLIDDVLDTTITYANTASNYGLDAVVVGSGLTSGGYDAYFDDITVTPEPATMLILAAGGLLLRRRRTA